MAAYTTIEKVNNGYLVEEKDDELVEETDAERHVFTDFEDMVEWLREKYEPT